MKDKDELTVKLAQFCLRKIVYMTCILHVFSEDKIVHVLHVHVAKVERGLHSLDSKKKKLEALKVQIT